MCGRFVGYRSLEQLKAFFPIDRAPGEVAASYNIAPSQEVLAIIRRDGENRLEKFHWGLVPFWAKDTSMGNRMINARAETVATKPSFRHAFKKRRCLIIADGFYEWRGTRGEKQPVYLTASDASPFAFAGLWETWKKSDDACSIYRSCTIITTGAGESIRDIHHRMPVMLKPDVYDTWLDPEHQNIAVLETIIKNDILTELTVYPVSRQVNAVRNNDPSNIAPHTQLQLDI